MSLSDNALPPRRVQVWSTVRPEPYTTYCSWTWDPLTQGITVTEAQGIQRYLPPEQIKEVKGDDT